LTDYDQVTKDNLPRAMENWVEVTRRSQGADADPPNLYANEVFRRFKLDLVEDRDALESASIDRVRACERASARMSGVSSLLTMMMSIILGWALCTRKSVLC
jgi:hypothetical protein